MLEARILEITKIELCSTGYYYNLKYKLHGEIKEVEIFREYNTLRKGDIIYV